MKEQQKPLTGIPETPKQTHWRITYQYQGPNYALRAGSLIIPEDNIEKVRITANGVLKDTFGDKWFNITKITNVGAPF